MAAVALVAFACTDTDTPDEIGVTGGVDAEGVPMQFSGPGDPALMVPVFVNGQGPYDFILDTGATLTCVDPDLARDLALTDAPGQIGGGITLEGGVGAVRLVAVDSLRVGAANAMGLTGCVVDLSQFRAVGVDADGLLGLNFLRVFRVTLDFQQNRMHLDTP